jgi:hypothetical protein
MTAYARPSGPRSITLLRVPPTSDHPELTIALAEYEHISQLRDRLEQKCSGRFNFFLAVATAVTAVAAGLLSQEKVSGAALGAVLTLGAMVLFMGLASFIRQVEFTVQGSRLVTAQDSLRTFLARHAPELKPYLLLPVSGDAGVYQPHNRRSPRWLRETVGLAGTIALLNSALLGLTVGLVAGGRGPGQAADLVLATDPWPPAVAAASGLCSFALHIGYLRYVRHSWSVALNKLVDERAAEAEGRADASVEPA